MILGKIESDERRIRLTVENITCNRCAKSVPGGITVSERIYGTDEFQVMLSEFLESYLCGVCRDMQRVAKNASA